MKSRHRVLACLAATAGALLALPQASWGATQGDRAGTTLHALQQGGAICQTHGGRDFCVTHRQRPVPKTKSYSNGRSGAHPASGRELVTTGPVASKPLPKKKALGALPLGINDDTTAPSRCNFNDADGGYTAWPDRFTLCKNTEWTLSEYIRDEDGELILQGDMVLHVHQWMVTASSGQKWGHGIEIIGGPVSGDVTEVTLQLDSTCETELHVYCVVDDPNDMDTSGLTWYTNDWWSQYIVEDNTGAATNSTTAIDDLTGETGYFFTWINPEYGDENFEDRFSAGLRCDGGPVGNNDGGGCVDENFQPTLSYDGYHNSTIAPIAAHVYAAQESIAAHWGVPNWGQLTRTTSSTVRNQNYQAACSTVVLPNPTTDSCDEFPFASTYQGAYYYPNFNSTAIVPKGAQNSQGGINSSFYQTNRVLDNEAFYVEATTANGDSSWDQIFN